MTEDIGKFPALDSVTEAMQLPHGGTVDSYRLDCAKRGTAANGRHQELFTVWLQDDRELTKAERAEDELMVAAGNNAWTVVALLAWIGREFGPDQAHRAAAIAQDIAMNGDPWDSSLVDDVFEQIEAAARPSPPTTAKET